MKKNDNNQIDYTIVSKPAFVSFICPHCFNDVEIQDTEDTIWNQSIKNIGK